MPKQLPKTNIFSTLEFTVLCSSISLSYFRSGKEPAFGKKHNQNIVVLVDSQARVATTGGQGGGAPLPETHILPPKLKATVRRNSGEYCKRLPPWKKFCTEVDKVVEKST